MKTVYLAGPITGLTYGGSVEWRDEAIRRLHNKGIKGLSPMRAKHFLKALGTATLSGTGEEYQHLNPLSTSRGIMTRDFNDATTCDVLLVNLLGAERPSIGTIMEIAWAWQRRTPVVIAMEASGNPHEHMMLAEATGYRVETLDEALAIVEAIICPDPLAFVDAA